MTDYIERALSQEVLAMAEQYPVVTLTGPRQSGKTALVQRLFPEKAYISLEDPDQREKIAHDPRAFLARYGQGAILDEIQRLPELMSYLQTHVDKLKQNNLFVLTGSHQLMLHQAISQSLAGRTALLQLLPLSLPELENETKLSTEAQILKGFYPKLYQAEGLNPTKFYRDYLQTYVERDVRMLIHLKDLAVFQQFLRLCAGRVGQLVNFESFSNEIGVSANTIKHWLSILEASFIIYRLQPYHENLGKRLTKSAKLYFVDVGLAAYLLGIETEAQLARDPAYGHLFENMVVMDVYKTLLNQGQTPSLYFFRDHQEHEVDLLIQKGREFIAIEIKSSQTFSRHFLKGLAFVKQLLGEARILRSCVIYRGEDELLGNIELLHYSKAARNVTMAE